MECRVCGHDALLLFYTQGIKDQFKFYKCSNCSLVNLDMSQGMDQSKYTLEYIDPDDKLHKRNIDQSASYQFIKKNISVLGKYLDIGCGNGKLLQLAKNDGWDVYGLELSQFFADRIKERLDIDVVVSNFMNYESDIKYDLVTLRHVLEHIPDSILALTKINGLLKDGGYAVMEFPNIQGLSFKMKRFFNRIGFFEKKYKEEYAPGHCNEFSKKSFKYLLSKTGFRLTKWVTYSSKPLMNIFYYNIPIGGKARVIIQKESEAN